MGKQAVTGQKTDPAEIRRRTEIFMAAFISNPFWLQSVTQIAMQQNAAAALGSAEALFKVQEAITRSAAGAALQAVSSLYQVESIHASAAAVKEEGHA